MPSTAPAQRAQTPVAADVVGWPFAVVIALGAFLLFQVEPIMGKLILPSFGGSAAVWTTCVLFFQVVLVAGYAFAHLSARHLTPRFQAIAYVALLVGSVLVLPISSGAGWQPKAGDDPSLRLLALLAVTVGWPFLVLASTGPLLQSWYARQRGIAPYRLYALSNGASLLGLLSYPLIVEPALTNHGQAGWWSLLYGAFVVLAAGLAVRAGGGARRAGGAPVAAVASGMEGQTRATGRYPLFAWTALAACPSLLFLAITNQLSRNVAPIPFLWVLPLSIYLISLIICFDSPRWYRRRLWLPLFPIGLGLLAWLLTRETGDLSIVRQVELYSAGLFVCCMVCHGELTRLRPHPRHLTAFYLTVSAGGALGGLLVAVAAPLVLPDFFEFQLGLLASAAIVGALLLRELRARRRRVRVLATLTLSALCLALAAYLAGSVRRELSGALSIQRNFYGALKVADAPAPGGGPLMRTLYNGTVEHGEQLLDPRLRRRPTAYYGHATGIGMLLDAKARRRDLRVGVIGLGAGTLATYGRPGDDYRFYEIDPHDIAIARRWFTFLRDARARTHVIEGDARLSLQREPGQRFDVLAADAFTGDSVPTHLLTREAFGLYLRHLRRGGVLAVHISNYYLDLGPIVARAAETLGMRAVLLSNGDDDAHFAHASDWALISTDRALLRALVKRADGSALAGAGVRPWTDDYINLTQALSW